MGILEEILEKQNDIIIRLQYLEKSITTHAVPDDTSLMTSKEMIDDLGISKTTFYRYIPEMPFLIKIRGSRVYKARRSDFEKWKKEFVNQ